MMASVLIWHAIMDLRSPGPAGAAMGLIYALALFLAALAHMLKSSDAMDFDRVKCEIRQVHRRDTVRCMAFSDVASIGLDRVTDPRNNAIWLTTGALRLRNGGTVRLVNRQLDIERVGQLTGLTVEHRTIWLEQPENSE